ncbi:MAG: hypothetical protein ACFFFG_01180 [Candidatus Thorarchaeota archaeon]
MKVEGDRLCICDERYISYPLDHFNRAVSIHGTPRDTFSNDVTAGKFSVVTIERYFIENGTN